MNEAQSPPNKSRNWIRLAARIWSAPVILVTFFIALGNIWSWLTNGAADPYAVESASTIEALPPTLMLISAIGLALAWKWEKFGGGFSLFFTVGVVIVLLIQGRTPGISANFLIPFLLSLVILVPGILFLIYGIRSARN